MRWNQKQVDDYLNKDKDEPESTLQKKITQWCRERGYPCLSFRQSPKVKGVITPGWPDLTLCLEGGRTLFIELKRKKGGYLSEKQKAMSLMLNYLQHEWYQVKTWKRFMEIIEEEKRIK